MFNQTKTVQSTYNVYEAWAWAYTRILIQYQNCTLYEVNSDIDIYKNIIADP